MPKISGLSKQKKKPERKKLYLICNAHLDPVWLWDWEEGAAEAVSTFRTAALFCKEFGGFIFNHNEAILYKWVEEYEPALFALIKQLVKKGKWHIMGGWYLQPDCNMPSGESIVRQILIGRKYFIEKFGEAPGTAINLDSFGHSRGLVQILEKSGYDSYLFCRPGDADCPLPGTPFIWKGFNNSKITAHRVSGAYFSEYGKAGEKVKNWVKDNPDVETGVVLWGVGNHGGGPSRKDLSDLAELMKEQKTTRISHSTPEKYFRDIKKSIKKLPEYNGSLNPWGVGCYTSQIKIKQKYRLLENEYYMSEKMISSASLQGLMDYPSADLNSVMLDLLTSAFHDILPGTSVRSVEESSLRRIDHGLEILSGLKTKAFFALASGGEAPKEHETAIFAYNPHPHAVKGIFSCELQLPDRVYSPDVFHLPEVYYKGRKLPSQVEKEESNVPIEWRKKVVFTAELQPSRINRFDCRMRILSKKPEISLARRKNRITFRNDRMEVVVNCESGLVDKYCIDGSNFLEENSLQMIVMKDDEDPWGMRVRDYKEAAGIFKLMSASRSAKFAGIKRKTMAPVRVIEDGDSRSVIEAFFSFGDSKACVHYKLPWHGTEIELEICVNWQEKDKMLKLSLPTLLRNSAFLGQTVYGAEVLKQKHSEVTAQKWSGIFSKDTQKALTVINDGIYGASADSSRIRLTLLRSPAFAAHPVAGKQTLAQDRFSPRIDQGESFFRFWINAGDFRERRSSVDREAISHNEKPFLLPFSPSGSSAKSVPAIILDDNSTCLSAFKQSEYDNGYIIRLFEPAGTEKKTTVRIPLLGIAKRVKLNPFEILSLYLDMGKKCLKNIDLMEQDRS